MTVTSFLGSNQFLMGSRFVPQERIQLEMVNMSSDFLFSFHISELPQYLLKGEIELPKSELCYETICIFIRRVALQVAKNSYRGLANVIIIPSVDRNSNSVSQVTQVLQGSTPLRNIFETYTYNDFEIITSDILPEYVILMYVGNHDADRCMTIVDDTCYYLDPDTYLPYTSYYKLIPIETFDNVVKEYIEQYEKENND